MVGQSKLRNRLSTQISENRLSRFIILVGDKGQGKKTLAEWIVDTLGYIKYVSGIKISDIRETIDSAYRIVDPTVFIISDADTMSEEAKNALLKVVEEPPNNAYFILTLQDLDNTLPTIRGRAVSYKLDVYSQVELMEYCKGCKIECDTWILSVAENPYELKQLVSYGNEFDDYVNLVVDNVAETSGSNSFKIANRLALRGEDDKYDLKLFWRAFILLCLKRYKENVTKFCKAVQITSKYIQDLRVRGINLQAHFDMWLLDIRQEWL